MGSAVMSASNFCVGDPTQGGAALGRFPPIEQFPWQPSIVRFPAENAFLAAMDQAESLPPPPSGKLPDVHLNLRRGLGTRRHRSTSYYPLRIGFWIQIRRIEGTPPCQSSAVPSRMQSSLKRRCLGSG